MWAISVNVRTCCCRGFNRLVFVNGNVWSVSYLVIALFHQQKLNRIWKDGAYSPKIGHYYDSFVAEPGSCLVLWPRGVSWQPAR